MKTDEFLEIPLKEKLNTNSKNSSKSPSSDPFKTTKKKQHGAGKAKALKQGAQKGHPGKGRELLPPEKVDSFVACLPQTTCDCGGHIQANPNKFKRHQQFELPQIKPIVTEFQLIYGGCAVCGKIHCASLPSGVPNTCLGSKSNGNHRDFYRRLSLEQTCNPTAFERLFCLVGQFRNPFLCRRNRQ